MKVIQFFITLTAGMIIHRHAEEAVAARHGHDEKEHDQVKDFILLFVPDFEERKVYLDC